MVVNLERIGQFEVLEHVEETILNMPCGMLGFKEQKQYVLIESDQYEPFSRLQAIGNPRLGFVVINPLDFFPDYDIEVSDSDAEQLGLSDARDARLISTVTFDRAEGWMTTNLLGPIVINTRLLIAKQIVLEDDRYGTKHLIGNRSHYEMSKARKQAV